MGWIRGVLVAGAFAVAGLPVSASFAADIGAWAAYVNPRYGFTVYYPDKLFEPGEEVDDASGRVFHGSGEAELRVSGALDERRFGAKHYSEQLKENGEPGEIKDLKVEDFSYTYTADRGDTLHFKRVVFTCREQVINRLELTYPTAERETYEAIIPRLVQRFQAGLGYDTPDNCV
jgi:hypothetical protein